MPYDFLYPLSEASADILSRKARELGVWRGGETGTLDTPANACRGFTDYADVLYSLADVMMCHFAGTVWLFQPCQAWQGFLFVCKE